MSRRIPSGRTGLGFATCWALLTLLDSTTPWAGQDPRPHAQGQVVVTQWAQSRRAGFEAVDPQGRPLLIQEIPGGRAAVFLPSALGAEPARIHVRSRPTRDTSPPELEALRQSGRVMLRAWGRTVAAYQEGAGELPRADIPPIFRRGGYLHPLFTPQGLAVTDDYPPNHVHHHGVWSAWTRTEFEGRRPDFWNMGEGKGTVRWLGTDSIWSGPVAAGFTARHEYVDLTPGRPTVVLRESWEVMLHRPASNPPSAFILDLRIVQECATDAALQLPRYHYGGLGFRGLREWDGADRTVFLTSEGERDRVRGNESRGHWCYIGGRVGERSGGVAILCHPENFRSPQPMRLHPTEPFFCYAPSQLGDWEIGPGRPYVARYRLVLLDGPPNRSQLEAFWQQYAAPPVVELRMD